MKFGGIHVCPKKCLLTKFQFDKYCSFWVLKARRCTHRIVRQKDTELQKDRTKPIIITFSYCWALTNEVTLAYGPKEWTRYRGLCWESVLSVQNFRWLLYPIKIEDTPVLCFRNYFKTRRKFVLVHTHEPQSNQKLDCIQSTRVSIKWVHFSIFVVLCKR